MQVLYNYSHRIRMFGSSVDDGWFKQPHQASL